MKRVVITALLAYTLPSRAGAEGAPSGPRMPSAVAAASARPASRVALAQAQPDQDALTERPAGKKAPESPTIRLGEKHETDQPRRAGIGLIPPGKIDVQAKGNQLMTILTSASYSHNFLGPHSDFLSTIQLVQEFDVRPGDPEEPQVMLAMGAKLDGYLRTEKKGTACLRRADAVISPVGGGPRLELAFRPNNASGNTIIRCEGESRSPGLVTTPGRFVLVVTLEIETTADGLFRSHAEAVFAPGRREGSWTSPISSAPEEEEGEDFGLAVTVRVDPPPPR